MFTAFCNALTEGEYEKAMRIYPLLSGLSKEAATEMITDMKKQHEPGAVESFLKRGEL